MSNYIYNDNFIDIDNDNNIDNDKKPSNKKNYLIIALFVACALIAAIFGWLGGLLFGGTSKESTSTQYKSLPTTLLANEGKDLNLANVVEKIKDSVVEIQTEYVVHSSYYQAVRSGAGSGVIVAEYSVNGNRMGYDILTNAHVIEGSASDKIASTITVILTDGSEYKAECVGYDTIGDIAVLRIKEEEKELECASYSNSSSLRVGDSVMAIGNPLGELGGSVTTGIISALDREISIDGNIMNLMQTNAAINPGNSGGGLFDYSGSLIGIVTAKSSGSGIEGLGFAIPANDAFKIYNDIINHGYVRGRSYIGVVFAEYVDSSIRIYSLDTNYNEKVFRTYDKIIAINGTEITSVAQIGDIVRKSEIGSTLTFTVVRDKQTITVEAKVFEYQP